MRKHLVSLIILLCVAGVLCLPAFLLRSAFTQGPSGENGSAKTTEALLREIHETDRELTSHEEKLNEMERDFYGKHPKAKEYRQKWTDAGASRDGSGRAHMEAMRASPDSGSFFEHKRLISRSFMFLHMLDRMEDVNQKALLKEYLSYASVQMKKRDDVVGYPDLIMKNTELLKEQLIDLLGLDKALLDRPVAFWTEVEAALPKEEERIRRNIARTKEASKISEEYLARLKRNAVGLFDLSQFYTLEFVLLPREIVAEQRLTAQLYSKYGSLVQRFRETHPHEQWPPLRKMLR